MLLPQSHLESRSRSQEANDWCIKPSNYWVTSSIQRISSQFIVSISYNNWGQSWSNIRMTLGSRSRLQKLHCLVWWHSSTIILAMLINNKDLITQMKHSIYIQMSCHVMSCHVMSCPSIHILLLHRYD